MYEERQDLSRTFVSIRGTPVLRATDEDRLIARDDHIARLPVHDGTTQGRAGFMYFVRCASAPAPRRLVHQHAVRSRNEQIRGRSLVRRLAKAEGRDGLRGGLMHGARLWYGCEECGT